MNVDLKGPTDQVTEELDQFPWKTNDLGIVKYLLQYFIKEPMKLWRWGLCSRWDEMQYLLVQQDDEDYVMEASDEEQKQRVWTRYCQESAEDCGKEETP